MWALSLAGPCGSVPGAGEWLCTAFMRCPHVVCSGVGAAWLHAPATLLPKGLKCLRIVALKGEGMFWKHR